MSKLKTSFPFSSSSSEDFTVPPGNLAWAVFRACSQGIFARALSTGFSSLHAGEASAVAPAPRATIITPLLIQRRVVMVRRSSSTLEHQPVDGNAH